MSHFPDATFKRLTAAEPVGSPVERPVRPPLAWTDEQAYHMGRGAYECSVLPADSGSEVRAFWQLTSLQQAGWIAKAAVAAERERRAPLVARLERIAEGVRVYGAPDKDLLAQRIENLCAELKA